MEALHDVVKAGKVRYLGASSMWAWQFAKMQHTAELNGWTKFVAMQDLYNLLQREEEREMFGLLADQGVGSIPWSPLAKGRLARPYGHHDTTRGEIDPVGKRFFGDGNVDIIARRAADRGETRHPDGASRPGLGAAATRSSQRPIVGATKPHHLADAVAALDVHLTDNEIAALEEPYVPQQPAGF